MRNWALSAFICFMSMPRAAWAFSLLEMSGMAISWLIPLAAKRRASLVRASAALSRAVPSMRSATSGACICTPWEAMEKSQRHWAWRMSC
ncbi:hypothetical protein D3C79_812860 [compost metagenome]